VNNQQLILDCLNKAGIAIGSSPIPDPGNAARYFVFIATSSDAAGRLQPTRRTLNEAAASLAQQGLIVEFLLADNQSKDIEAGVRATLLHSFPNDVRNVFLTVHDDIANVWIDAKRALDQSRRDAMKGRMKIFLTGLELTLGAVSTLGEANIPGKVAILKAIRLSAPSSPLEISALLKQREFVIPSNEWLTRRLDALRRSDEIVRLHDGTYGLTASALRSLGASQHGRSPDVSRLLALARGKR
jgi:hypothetical protein